MKSTKLQNLEQKFNLAQTLVDDLSGLVDDLTTDEFIPMVLEEGGELETIPSDSILNLNELKMDFQLVRQNIMKVVAAGNRILDGVSVLDLDDLKPMHLTALAQLQTALGSNIALLLASYKDIAAIEKARQTPAPKGNSKEVPSNMTQNNVNIFSGSTADLLTLINSQTETTLIDLG